MSKGQKYWADYYALQSRLEATTAEDERRVIVRQLIDMARAITDAAPPEPSRLAMVAQIARVDGSERKRA